MKYIKIALRNLSRQKKRSFLLAGAIGFGILIIIMINAFTAGLAQTMFENFSKFYAGQIFISGYEKSSSGRTLGIIRDDTLLCDAIKKADMKVIHTTERSGFMGNIIFAGKGVLQKIDGVSWDGERDFTKSFLVVSGSMAQVHDRKALVLSQSIIDKLGVRIGEAVLVKLRTISGQPNVGEFVVVAGLKDSSMLDAFSAYANLDYVNYLLNIPQGQYQTLALDLADSSGVEKEADRLIANLAVRVNIFPREKNSTGSQMQQFMTAENTDETWSGVKYQLLTLNDYLAGILSVVDVLNTVGFVVLLVLFTIIMVGISNTFRMILRERIREIGTMRAMGMQKSGIKTIFILEAVFLSLLGFLAGLLLSVIAIIIIGAVNFDTSSPLYFFTLKGKLQFLLLPGNITANVLLVVLFSLLASYLPAKRAAKMAPVEALQIQN